MAVPTWLVVTLILDSYSMTDDIHSWSWFGTRKRDRPSTIMQTRTVS